MKSSAELCEAGSQGCRMPEEGGGTGKPEGNTGNTEVGALQDKSRGQGQTERTNKMLKTECYIAEYFRQ